MNVTRNTDTRKKNAYNLYKLSQTLTKEENKNSQNDSAKLGRTYRVV